MPILLRVSYTKISAANLRYLCNGMAGWSTRSLWLPVAILTVAMTAAVTFGAEIPPADWKPLASETKLMDAGISPKKEGITKWLETIRVADESELDIDALIGQLGSNDSRERKRASRRLALLWGTAKDAVETACADKDPEVRIRALALRTGYKKGDGRRLLLAALSTARRRGIELDEGLLFDLAPLCVHASDAAALTRCLVQNVTTYTDKAVTRALAHPSAAKRRVALGVITKLAPNGANLEMLSPLLVDPDEQTRMEAALTLIARGNTYALPTLSGLLNSERTAIRYHAHRILRRLSGKAFGFKPHRSPDKQKKAINQWRQWTTASMFAGTRFDTRSLMTNISLLNGNTLMAFGNGNNVMEIDADGKTVWTFNLAGVWGAEKMPNGNVLIASHSQNRAIEVDMAGDIVWQANGNYIKAVPLNNGNVLLADLRGKRAVEINKDGVEVWTCNTTASCTNVQRIENGNTIYSAANMIKEVSPDGEVVWEYQLPQGSVYGFQRLANGNTLVADYFEKVIELTPDKEVVWSYDIARAVDVYRLGNGNTLITTVKRAVEVTRDKQVVWQRDGFVFGSVRK